MNTTRGRGNNAKKKLRAVVTAKRAASKFRDLVFEDPITLSTVGKSKGMLLNKKWYARNSIRQAIKQGTKFVPHSRRPLTQQEIALALTPVAKRAGRGRGNRIGQYRSAPPALIEHLSQAGYTGLRMGRAQPGAQPWGASRLTYL